MPHQVDCQVLIVGGGPVGLGLAVELGQRGISCTVIERYTQPQPIPKGQNLTQRTLEHFHFWGAEKDLRAARIVPREYGIGGVTVYGNLLSDYHYDWLQRGLVRPFYFTDNERLPQYATEAVLRQRVAELDSVETRYGWTLQAIAQDADGVSAEIGDGKNQRTVRALYAVGCDGSHSRVRDQAGLTQTLADHDRLMVLLVFRSEGLHRLLARFHSQSYFSVLHPDMNGYWQFFGRVDLGTTWFFHAPVPPGTTKDNFDFRALLHRAAGAEFDVSFDYVGFWNLRFAVADQYRKDRVFVAGDAAHSHPPYGGYGINTGLEDAVNLGWKLAATLKGWGGEQLLDSYNDERKPVYDSTARDFIAASISRDRDFLAAFDPARDKPAFIAEWRRRQAGTTAEVNSFEPHYEGSPVMWGPPGGQSSAVGSHDFAARAGHHLAPQTLSSGRNVFEELGEDFSLLALDAPENALQMFVSAAHTLQVPLKVIRDSRSGERERCNANLVLIRPDQFVAWAAEDTQDAAAVLKRAVGKP